MIALFCGGRGRFLGGAHAFLNAVFGVPSHPLFSSVAYKQLSHGLSAHTQDNNALKSQNKVPRIKAQNKGVHRYRVREDLFILNFL